MLSSFDRHGGIASQRDNPLKKYELASLRVYNSFASHAKKPAPVSPHIISMLLHVFYNRYSSEPTAAAATANRPPVDTFMDRSPALGFEAALPLGVPLELPAAAVPVGVELAVGVASVLAGAVGLGVCRAMFDKPFVAVPVQKRLESPESHL